MYVCKHVCKLKTIVYVCTVCIYLSIFCQVNKVAGNFHIAHGESIVRDGKHIHQFNPLLAPKFNVSHTIHSISFGDPYPSMPANPLDNGRNHYTLLTIRVVVFVYLYVYIFNNLYVQYVCTVYVCTVCMYVCMYEWFLYFFVLYILCVMYIICVCKYVCAWYERSFDQCLE